MHKLIVGVDLGATKILTGLATTDGRILASVKMPTDCNGLDAKGVLDSICAGIDRIIMENTVNKDNIKAIVVASPGPLQYPQGIIRGSPNLGWQRVCLKKELSNRMQREVLVDKDTNIAALGEYYYGQDSKYQELLYVTISTGIGGGIIANGQVYHGVNGAAGEFGHMVIDPYGPLCNCGRRGCLEALASGTAIAKEANQLIEKGKGKGILAVCQPGGNITAKEVGAAARQGDAEAKAIISKAAQYIGIGLANLVNIFNPQMVVLGGGAGIGLKDLLFETICEVVDKNVFRLHKHDFRMEMSKLGDQIGIWGCLAAAISAEIS